MGIKWYTKIFQEETKTAQQVFQKSFFHSYKNYKNLFESVKWQSKKNYYSK